MIFKVDTRRDLTLEFDYTNLKRLKLILFTEHLAWVNKVCHEIPYAPMKYDCLL